ncbi:hypothetical protein GUITHDRAFT_107814 [Guillardia theta CCMP2712]|uniref:SURP motif domain-containing protein n=1 Tax=Guillardia theta (strain CCMP2712) TaxID=905079 RepID=L1JCE4_GUITC|nr:hypothetical protein GUITHDRAFT_107814 [Guillardia theta CCMP2712]EKX46196.1 hypothetical protein GUITHDRAFT_107814 [Guillardia theta CCMP2712]|eukprot:XP_005833176.1 hypothetical protein GUITHDRAFT_107814 [Guillardia theta CCMP2712]
MVLTSGKGGAGMQDVPAQGESAPVKAPIAFPPLDPELLSTIDKTSGYVARNGKAFEDMIREREGANPKFTFLREKGEGCEYFRWRVYCLQMKFEKHEMDAMLREAFPPLGEEDLNTFKEMLTSLTGSKDHIRSMRAWIMSHEENVEFICEHFHARIISIKEFQPRLHIVYVLNDVLHACLKKRMDPSIIGGREEPLCSSAL